MAENMFASNEQSMGFLHVSRDVGLWLIMVIEVSLMVVLLRSLSSVDHDVFVSIHSIVLVSTGYFLFQEKERLLNMAWKGRMLYLTAISVLTGGGMTAFYLLITGSF